MGYRIAGRCTDLCSCHTPCPCALGQTPTGGTCAGILRVDGRLDVDQAAVGDQVGVGAVDLSAREVVFRRRPQS